jgi:DNA (cytosine-5)-methyltransferase 1
MELKQLSLFSGIGGPDLAAEWMGWENISHTEWNPFGQRVLQYYWPNATSHHDITKTDYSIYRGRVDILTGGFPCQGFSLAGKRMGTDDDRYLWPEMRRAYNECKPRVIIGENVTGLLSMEDKSGIYRDVFPKVEGGKVIRTLECDYYEKVYTRQAQMLIDSICNDLEEDGYEVQPFVIPAAAVQAPHKRDRVWIIAYANGDGYGCNDRHSKTGCQKAQGERNIQEFERVRNNIGRISTKRTTSHTHNEQSQKRAPFRNGQDSKEEESRLDNRVERYGDIRNVADSNSIGRPFKKYGKKKSRRLAKACIPDDWSNFPTQSPVCDGNDGISARLDPAAFLGDSRKPISYSKWRAESIKAGGNAIVPQVILQFFKAIDEYLSQQTL